MADDAIEERLQQIERWRAIYAATHVVELNWLIAQVRTLRQRVAEVQEKLEWCSKRRTEEGNTHQTQMDALDNDWRQRVAEAESSFYYRMAKWAAQKWDEQVKDRPDVNIYRPGLNSAWKFLEKHCLERREEIDREALRAEEGDDDRSSSGT